MVEVGAGFGEREEDMIVERCAGYITVKLEDDDFKHKPWRKVLDELKIAGAEYHADEKAWYLEDNMENEDIVNGLYEEFFKDENQLEMF